MAVKSYKSATCFSGGPTRVTHVFCYVSHPLITLSGSMQVQRWTSGAVGWSCTPCCVALCPSMMSTSPRSLRRSEEASSTSPSTWLALWLRCSCSCCRWTLWREPPSKTSGAHPTLLGQVALTEASFMLCVFEFFLFFCCLLIFALVAHSLWSVALASGPVLCWGLLSGPVKFFMQLYSLPSIQHYLQLINRLLCLITVKCHTLCLF